MWIILDLIIVAIVLLFVFISAKRGFARTVVEFVGYILAVYLAFTVGGIISTAVYDGVIEPAIVSSTTEKIVDTAGESVDSTVNNVWDSLPDLVTKGAESFGITSDYLKNSLTENSINTENAMEAKEESWVKLRFSDSKEVKAQIVKINEEDKNRIDKFVLEHWGLKERLNLVRLEDTPKYYRNP